MSVTSVVARRIQNRTRCRSGTRFSLRGRGKDSADLGIVQKPGKIDSDIIPIHRMGRRELAQFLERVPSEVPDEIVLILIGDFAELSNRNWTAGCT
jgi:hypothetical protein